MNRGFLFDTQLSDPLSGIAYALTLEALRVGPNDNPSVHEIETCVEASVITACTEHPDLIKNNQSIMIVNVLNAVLGLRDAYLLADEPRGNA